MSRGQAFWGFVLLALVTTAATGCAEPLAGSQSRWAVELQKGRSFCQRGQFQEAVWSFNDVITNLEQTQAKPSVIAGIYDERGTIFKVMGKYRESERDYLRAVDLLESEGGRKGISLALVLSHLGAYYMEAGQFSRAESYLKESRAMADAAQAPQPSDYASLLQNLAVLSFQRKEYTNAEDMFRRSLELLYRDEKANHWQIAVIKANLACVLGAQDRKEEALATADAASAAFHEAPGMFPSCFITTLVVTAQIQHMLKRNVEAAANSEEALRLCEKVLGPNSPKLISLLSTYAVALKDLHHNKEAKAMNKRAEQIRLEYASRTHSRDLLDVSALLRSARN